MNRELYLICRIIFTSLFVTISTIVWFTRKDNIYHELNSNIEYNNIEISNLKKFGEEDITYNLKITNNEDRKRKVKVYIVSNVLSNSVSNNYIKYQVNDNTIKSLNMDGLIIISELLESETKNINLKIWISDTYSGELNYEGRVIAT